MPFGKPPIINSYTKPNTFTRSKVFCGRTLSSESFGAGFGSALATIDANGDGRDDLLVGLSPTDGTTHLRPLIMI